MSLTVHAPLSGTLAALANVPDPVFAAQMGGSGMAVEPVGKAGPLDVVAPVSGQVATVRAHAFVIRTDGGAAILVHLGIDTVRLNGEGFHTHVTEGERVAVGRKVITFDPDAIRARGLSAICPVVVLDSTPGSAQAPAVSGPVRAGALMFSWAAS
ncbi:PTS glucose transporter subunit IIA [Streptomyces sp. WAC 01325]|uniref:PTS sugar transporter subunit IIA n=1 Tax=Streptomyces sp. WAC 01325 TaxID=2203202 RepID=UPI000F881685|nr:PTS glucose transporter subunit IIA [Streptomyces sp. WAC 01325]RSN07827.1 PTS glucose transporter subunit IIA [Streptomyces sp. WAC 01325]